VKHRKKRAPRAIRLAQGFRLDGDGTRAGGTVLVSPEGRVQLNLIAAAILTLCDGTRSREDVVVEVLRNSPTSTRAAEIREFIDVAIERGWIAEN
jgi:pyrroloquinoline quinone biosynthesis protein D